MTNPKTATQTIKNWTKRREDKGITASADETWAQINKNWPTMSPQEKETVFQESA